VNVKGKAKMPLFDFVCAACGTQFEQLIRTSSQTAQAVVCPACKSTETQKKLSTFAVAGYNSPGNSAAAANCAPGGT
jgi:putative FmdB family regulatory protein